MSRALRVFLSLGLAAVLSGCGTDSSPGESDGGSGGSGSAGGPGGGGAAATGTKCEDVDYASYATGQPTLSFKTDIMPIFGFGCVQGDCHNHKDKKAGLNLGVKCQFDAATKACNYPATSDSPGDVLVPQPLDDATLDAVYASLMENAATVLSPPTKRVIAGDPEHSFLIEKLSGNQNQAAYDCKSTDTSHAVDKTSKCGDSMPLGSNRLCDGSSRYKFDKIAAWIQQGAQKN